MNTSRCLDDLLAGARRRRRLPPPPARRLLRAGAGLTQQQLAEALGVDRVTVTRWEGGRRAPRGARLDRYLGALDRLAAEAAGVAVASRPEP